MTYHAVHGQTVGGQNPGGQNATQNCKGGQNAGHFKGQGGPILSKHLIYDTDCLVN